jgi:hypothetical protein
MYLFWDFNAILDEKFRRKKYIFYLGCLYSPLNASDFSAVILTHLIVLVLAAFSNISDMN